MPPILVERDAACLIFERVANRITKMKPSWVRHCMPHERDVDAVFGERHHGEDERLSVLKTAA
jgi:hypothetical protein